MTALSVGVDVGGTFTDLVAVAPDGAVTSFKVSSTPADQSEGVEAALQRLSTRDATVDAIVHGTTIVTNMLLERTGARVVLCATAGASDLLELRRQERVALYDLSAHHPPALVPPDQVIAVAERVAPEGITRPLTPEAAADVARRVASLDPDIVAVSLLHAYADPSHERLLAEALRRELCVGGAADRQRAERDVVCSSDVLPEIREYERTATTVCEAYVRPGVGRYVARLASRLAAAGLPAPSVMSSSGGTAAAADAAQSGASLALSGPAGGVTGAALVARTLGIDRALTIDIGGTSADVGFVLDGEPLLEVGGAVAGVPIALPRVLVETVSAGGGSLAWIDDGGALRVGPRSAGVRPGPVAFRRGGTQPTVTDAHVAIGNRTSTRMGDGVELDIAAATAAVDALAARLDATRESTANAIVAIADAAMARALRRVSVERGVDPRDCALIAFGGGGPLHACGLADALDVRRVVVPPNAGVLSALGLAVAPRRYGAAASVMRRLDALPDTELARMSASLAVRATDAYPEADRARGVEIRHTARVRYVGQGHELDVEYDPERGVAALAAQFARTHGERYRFTLDRPLEVVSMRCTASTAGRAVRLERRGPSAWQGADRIDDGGVLDVTVRGRATIGLADATLLVARDWRARALPIGGWMLEREP